MLIAVSLTILLASVPALATQATTVPAVSGDQNDSLPVGPPGGKPPAEPDGAVPGDQNDSLPVGPPGGKAAAEAQQLPPRWPIAASAAPTSGGRPHRSSAAPRMPTARLPTRSPSKPPAPLTKATSPSPPKTEKRI